MMQKPLFSVLFFLLVLNACGGGSGETGDDTGEDDASGDTVNTAKLVGTPFEGKTTGDDFDWEFFLCGQYRTETIDALPIQIFAAFFTEAEEETIQEGIDVANEAMGPTDDGGVFYEMTDTWSDNVRVIYAVNEIIDEDGREFDASGHTRSVESHFNGTGFSEATAPDWRIEIVSRMISRWVVAHELGHASEIVSHSLIDYENDALTELEENSLMDLIYFRDSEEPALTDYNFMMQMQGQIMQNHLGESETTGGATCDGE